MCVCVSNTHCQWRLGDAVVLNVRFACDEPTWPNTFVVIIYYIIYMIPIYGAHRLCLMYA